MRTAAKLSLTVFLALALSPLAASAQMPAPGPGAVALPGEPPKEVAPAAPVEKTENKTKVTAPVAQSPADPNKVPDTVQNVLDKMNATSEDVTLEDLNTAREAIAKLDVLIDIEKRLADLASIRKEREDKTMTAVATALPPTAYAPPPVLSVPQGDLTPGAPFAMQAVGGSIGSSGPSKIEVLKIVGAEGRYTAFVKDSEDMKGKQIHQGDKMPDGSLVTSISRNGVTLSKGKKTSTFQVKDIGKVFSGR